MIYFATPSSPIVRAAMTAGQIGCMTTPGQGNVIPEGATYAADNGRFGKGWPGHDAWWSWLTRKVERFGPERCAWATAPDVMRDPVATLAESLPWLAKIRGLGVPVAFVAQDGCEHGDLIPWGQFDVLFLGGSTEWKLSPGAAAVAAEARRRGLSVHMGRVSSRRRTRIADALGCDSVDGTYLRFGPDKNLPTLLGWVDELHRSPSLFDIGDAP